MPKSAIETELLEACGFKPKKDYADRQDYLAALARAINNHDDETVLDNVSNAAADWYDSAVDAINDKTDLPEFPDAEDEAPAKGKSKKALKEEPEPEESSDDGEGAAEEAEKPARGKAKAKDKAKAKAPEKKPEKAAAKKVAKADDNDDGEAEEKPAKAKRSAPASSGAISLDRYGIAEGTKNAQAVAMLEKGAKMSDVNSEIGGTYYNLLKRLTKAGHKLLKEPGGELKLVHKDDYGKAVKGTKGKK